MGAAGLDFSVLYWMQGLHTPFLDQIMPVLTAVGNSGLGFVALGAVLLCMKKTRKTGFLVLLSLLAGFLIGNVAIKNLVMRPRPCWIDQTVPMLIAVPGDFSFPSGHTLAAFETAVTVFLADRRWGTPLLIFAAVMGLSRLYLFVHFPTDVLSGMALGIFIAWFVRRIVEKYRIYAILESTIKKNAE